MTRALYGGSAMFDARPIDGSGLENLLSDVVRFVERQMRKGCVRIALRQLAGVGGGADHLRDWRLDEEAQANDVADEIENHIRDEARQLRAAASFALFSYRPTAKDAGDYVERKLITTTERSSARTEAFDACGLPIPAQTTTDAVVGMLIGHTHASAKLALGHTNAIVDHYKSQAEIAQRRIALLERQQLEVIEMTQKLHAASEDRELARERLRQQGERNDFLKEKVGMLFPVLMSRLTARGGAAAPVFGEELMRQFLTSLTAEQMEAIFRMLTPEQSMVIGEIYSAFAAKEEASQQNATATQKKDAA